MKTIVKVQLPISRHIKDAPALIYNENGTLFLAVKVSSDLRRVMNGYAKKYFEAEVKRKTVRLLAEVGHQGW